MKQESKLLVSVLAVVVLAGAFWMLLLSPKREEASKLETKVEQLRTSLAQDQAEAANALAAKRQFSTNYSQLVVLGKAVPADSETASLLVQIQHISEKSHVRFEELTLESEGAAAPPPVAAPEGESSEGTAAASEASVSPTEVAASTTPLGAAVGPAGLSAMPYTLTFTGNFFHMADFVHGLDNLVKTTNTNVSVDGRLVTINGFSLAMAQNEFPKLKASFSVTTYLTPPEQGLTAGATPAGPEAAATTTGVQASATIGGTP
ncbi:MAG: type 4a pilus biogenesis protein PilO [Solirubrobacterales bacterium]